MKIEEYEVENIKEYENNARKIEKAVEAVKKSIESYGFLVPIIVDRNDVVIAGHTRLRAAEELGMRKVPVIRADDLTEEQANAFRLADNKTAELAEWDYEKLSQELKEIEDDLIESLFASREAIESGRTIGEIDLEEFDEDEFDYECPCCGYRF